MNVSIIALIGVSLSNQTQHNTHIYAYDSPKNKQTLRNYCRIFDITLLLFWVVYSTNNLYRYLMQLHHQQTNFLYIKITCVILNE